MINRLTQTRIILNIHNFFPHMIKNVFFTWISPPTITLVTCGKFSWAKTSPHVSYPSKCLAENVVFSLHVLVFMLRSGVRWGLSVVTIRPLLTGPPCPRPVSPGPASIHQVSAIPSPDCLLWLGTALQTNTKITKNSGKCPNIFKIFSHRIFTAFVSKCQCPLTF